jgi:hypothetical protein
MTEPDRCCLEQVAARVVEDLAADLGTSRLKHIPASRSNNSMTAAATGPGTWQHQDCGHEEPQTVSGSRVIDIPLVHLEDGV